MRNEKLKQAFSKIKQEITELKNQLSRIEETEENKKKEKTIVAASGYFDPVHLGHVEYLEKAKKLAEKINGKLVVIVNSDEQAIMKKGYVFMPQKERISIINSLKCVDLAVLSIDRDETVRESLRFLKPKIFAKGGDRKKGEIPELGVCKEYGIKIIDKLGKKIQSSSELVKKLKNKKTKQN